MGDPANPRIWVGATVYHAPLATTGPTDTTTALAAAWKDIGLLSDDGMTESRDQDSSDKFAYGGQLVRSTRSKFKRTFEVTAIEDNAEVWQLLNPGSTAVTATGITTRTVKAPTPDPQAWVFELIDGDVTKRLYIPRGEITEVGDRNIDDDELQAFPFTVTVYPAADGTFYKEITDDPAAVVA